MGVKSIFLSLVFSIVFIICGETTYGSAASQTNVKTMKEMKQAIEKNLTQYNTEFTIKYTGNMQQFNKQGQRVISELVVENDLVAGTLKTYQQRITTYSNKANVNYKIRYFTSKAKEKTTDKLVDKQVKIIKKTAKTDFAKVKAVNDFIVSNTTYGGTGDDRHTAYGVFQKRKAVCQGYALATYKMMKKLNIPVRYVVGNSKGQDHAWNKVKISGVWYNLDTTWNDPLPNSETEIGYRYFLISDEQLKKTHVWNTKNYPKSTSKKYNFLADASSAVLVGNTFYYSNSKDKEKLYSYNLKTNKKSKKSNIRVQYLVYANSKLYFSNYSNGGYLYSINLNGTKVKQLNKLNSYNLKLQNKYLYFKSNKKSYRLKLV